MAALFCLTSVLASGCDPDAATEGPVVEQQAFVHGEIIVRYHKEVAEDAEEGVLNRHKLSRIRRHPALRVDHLAIDDTTDVMDKIAQLEQDPDVLYAEPNYLYYPCDLPNDWSYRSWGVHNDGSYGVADADIDAREAWNITTGSRDVVVAVIDTGVDWDHPDLNGNLWVNEAEQNGTAGVDDDHNGYVDDMIGWDVVDNDNNPNDSDGHGTHVSGIVGAVGDNGTGIVGVNWRVSLMGLRYLGPYGGSTSDAVEAIEYAVDNGADVINASWGSTGYSYSIRDAISYANDHDVLFVAASGNEGRNSNSQGFYPASYNLPNIVSVASTTYNDRLASSSNYGSASVDLGAPGEPIYSTYPDDSYAWLSGTSMASPAVAGAAALALSVNSSVGAQEMKELLMSTTDPLNALQGLTVSGGRLNVNALVQAVGGGGQEDPPEEDPEEEPEEDPEEDPEEPEEEPEEDPGNGTDSWTYVPWAVSTDHPYTNDFSGYAVIDQAGASELMLHFSWLETEQGYDYVYLADNGGNVYQSYTGANGQFVTDPIAASTVNLWLITDYSVTGHGFDLAGYSWR